MKGGEVGRCRLDVEILGFPLLRSNRILIIRPLFFKQETGSIFSGESIQQGTSGDSDIGDFPQSFHIILSTLSQKLPQVLCASNEIFSYPLPLKKWPKPKDYQTPEKGLSKEDRNQKENHRRLENQRKHRPWGGKRCQQMLTSLVGSEKILQLWNKNRVLPTKKGTFREQKNVVLGIKILIAAIEDAIKGLGDKLRNSFRIWSEDLKRFF